MCFQAMLNGEDASVTVSDYIINSLLDTLSEPTVDSIAPPVANKDGDSVQGKGFI